MSRDGVAAPTLRPNDALSGLVGDPDERRNLARAPERSADLERMRATLRELSSATHAPDSWREPALSAAIETDDRSPPNRSAPTTRTAQKNGAGPP